MTSVYVDPIKGSVLLFEQRFKALPIDSGGGNYHQMMAIRGDGELMAWGRTDTRGYNLGLGDSIPGSVSIPRRVAMPFGKKVSKVTMSVSGASALTTDGLLSSWGNNSSGYVGDGTTTARYTPVLIPTVGTISKIYRPAQSRQDGSTFYLNDLGDIYRWGYFIGILTAYTTPTVMPRPVNSAKWKDFTAASGCVWAWTEDSDGNKAYAIGRNDNYQLGDGTTTNRTTWVAVLKVVDNTQLSNIKFIKWTTDSGSNGTTFFVLNNGDLYTCGYNGAGECGVGNTTNQTKAVYVMSNVSDVNPSFGTSGTISVVKTDGTLWAWGYNANGQVGDGTLTTPRTSPSQILINGASGSAITGVKSVFGGMGHEDGAMFFIKTDGTVWTTGYPSNTTSPMGLGINTSVSTYTQVLLGEPIDTMYVAYYYDDPTVSSHYPTSFFLARSGRLYACGYGYYGLIGNGISGNTVGVNTPCQVILVQ